MKLGAEVKTVFTGQKILHRGRGSTKHGAEQGLGVC